MKKLIAIVIILILILLGLFGVKSYMDGLDKPYNPEITDNVLIDIPMGSSTTDIGQILVDNGIIGNQKDFKLFSKINKYDGQYVAGIYSLNPSMTPTEICTTICEGKTASLSFTIPEGYTLDEITNTLVTTGLVNRETFVNLLENGNYSSEFEFLNGVPSGATPLEGYLFPDTYSIPYGANEDDIIRVMLQKFQDVYESEIKNNLAATGLNLHELLTLASIVEEESMHLSDKAPVASVIYNRLDVGMRLQMDTTVIYAMDEKKIDLTYDDIEIDSPYNTYLVDGLPIGPICCPGLNSIEAALHPADTDYYYFVVSDKGDGSIKFSENDYEFEEDKAAYYASREDEEG